MSLSEEQKAVEAKIGKSAKTWGIICGSIAAAIILILLSGANTFVWIGCAIMGGNGVGYGIYKWRYKSKSEAAVCEKCSASFSISQTDRSETLTGSSEEESREEQEDGSTKVTNWTEEQYDVVETYTCSKCADETTKEYKTTKRKDEKEVIEPAPKSSAGGQSKSASGKGDTAQTKSATKSEPDEPKSGRTGEGQKGGYT